MVISQQEPELQSHSTDPGPFFFPWDGMWIFPIPALWLHGGGRSITNLIPQVRDTLMLADKPFFLVLEEDGTVVETEEYFQALADDTVFMALQKGQKWQPPPDQVRCHLWREGIGNQKSLRGANHTLVSMQASRYQLSLSRTPVKKIDVARVTFDLYKLNPQDFIGCLNIKATLYGTYSLSYNLHCYGAKRVMK